MPKGQLTTEQRLTQNVARLKTLNAKLRNRVAELETANAGLQQQLNTQAIQIAELQTMVFGKKRQHPTGTPSTNYNLPAAPKPPRTKDSYSRPLPPASAITKTTGVPVGACRSWW